MNIKTLKRDAKIWISGFAWCCNVAMLGGLYYAAVMFTKPEPRVPSTEYYERLSEFSKNVTPLSTADLGNLE